MWETYISIYITCTDLEHVSWVRSVLHRSWPTYHNGRLRSMNWLSRLSRSWTIWCDLIWSVYPTCETLLNEKKKSNPIDDKTRGFEKPCTRSPTSHPTRHRKQKKEHIVISQEGAYSSYNQISQNGLQTQRQILVLGPSWVSTWLWTPRADIDFWTIVGFTAVNPPVLAKHSYTNRMAKKIGASLIAIRKLQH